MSPPPPTHSERLEFRLDGQVRAARPHDTVAGALIAHGDLDTSRSAKYRRPRGPYCLDGDCGTCLVRLDGRPNVRACMVEVRDGALVERQNVLRPAGLDPTALVDRIYAGGLDHHKLVIRPRLANRMMQEVARRLAGFGQLPHGEPPPAAHEAVAPEVLVVGAGPAGRSAGDELRAAGVDVLVVDRHDRPALDATPLWADPLPLHDSVAHSTAVFGAYPEEGVWGAVREDLRAPTALTIQPRHVILATGSRDPQLELVNNDLPGVVSARGLLRTLQRAGRGPATMGPVVVIGEGPVASRCAEELSARRVAPGDVRRIAGRGRVEAVELADGERVVARLVALAPSPGPASDLASQLGAAVRWNGAGFAVERDASGRCEASGPWTLWAAGDVTGWMGPARAAGDGRRVAQALIQHVGAADR